MITIDYFICLLSVPPKQWNTPRNLSVWSRIISGYSPRRRADGSRHLARLRPPDRVAARIGRLLRFISAIFDAGIDLFFRLTLQRIGEYLHFLPLPPPCRQRMIVQPVSPIATTHGLFASSRKGVITSSPDPPDIRWMNPDDREDIRISFRDLIARRLLAIMFRW